MYPNLGPHQCYDQNGLQTKHSKPGPPCQHLPLLGYSMYLSHQDLWHAIVFSTLKFTRLLLTKPNSSSKQNETGLLPCHEYIHCCKLCVSHPSTHICICIYLDDTTGFHFTSLFFYYGKGDTI